MGTTREKGEFVSDEGRCVLKRTSIPNGIEVMDLWRKYGSVDVKLMRKKKKCREEGRRVCVL